MSNRRPRPQGISCILSNNPAWSPAEDAALKQHYPTGTRAEVLAALPGRTFHGAQLRAAELLLKRHRYWTPARLRYLTKHYPTRGAAFVAAHVGCSVAKVTKKASLLGLARQYVPKPAPTPKVVKPKPAPKPSPVLPQKTKHLPNALRNMIAKQDASTPNLNAQKSQRKKNEAGPERAVPLSYIKSLPYQHPEAHQYRMGGERAVLAYRKQLQQQAA